MENAGRGAAEIIARLNSLRERTAIICGPGNNGGDGFVIARHLDRLGITATVWLIGDRQKITPDAAVNCNTVERMGLRIVATESQLKPDDLSAFGWIVDAMFGTGLRGAVRSPWAETVAAINGCGARVVAIDIPTGLDCDTGEPVGPTVMANHTISFVGMKEGFLAAAAQPYLGEVHFVDIGAPRSLVDQYLK
jgi:NAD(P)H-hydrate epimerase